MSRPIVFVDTETTALGHLARPWEIALIRRESDGREHEHAVRIAYPLNGLPDGTSPLALHIGGWLTRGVVGTEYAPQLPDEVDTRTYFASSEDQAARRVLELLNGEPVLVGVGVHFDAAVLSALFLRHGLPEQPWHYAIVDLKAATWALAQQLQPYGHDDPLRAARALPMRSEELAATQGVEPPADDERHTALGDARWAARWFDAISGGAA